VWVAVGGVALVVLIAAFAGWTWIASDSAETIVDTSFELRNGLRLLRVSAASSGVLDQMAAMNASAFESNTLYEYIFGELPKQQRFGAKEFLFRRNLSMQLRQEPGCLFIVVDANGKEYSNVVEWNGVVDIRPASIVCGFAIRSCSVKVTLLDLLRAGLLEMPLKAGWGSMSRMMEAMEMADKAQSKALRMQTRAGSAA